MQDRVAVSDAIARLTHLVTTLESNAAAASGGGSDSDSDHDDGSPPPIMGSVAGDLLAMLRPNPLKIPKEIEKEARPVENVRLTQLKAVEGKQETLESIQKAYAQLEKTLSAFNDIESAGHKAQTALMGLNSMPIKQDEGPACDAINKVLTTITDSVAAGIKSAIELQKTEKAKFDSYVKLVEAKRMTLPPLDKKK